MDRLAGWVVRFFRRSALQPNHLADCSSCRIVVTFHTPFATKYLDEKKLSRLSDDELEDVARDLDGAATSLSWEPLGSPLVALQGYDESVKAELRQQMPRPLLRARPTGTGHGVRRAPEGDWAWRDAELTFWNTGSAVLTVAHDVRPARGRSWSDLASRSHEDRKELAGSTDAWVRAACDELVRAAHERRWLDDWTTPPTANGFWSTSLWTFDWFVAHAPPEWSPEDVDAAAEALIPDGVTCRGAAPATRSNLRISQNACCVTRGDSEDETLLRNHVETHTACWGSALTLSSLAWEQMIALQFRRQGTRRLNRDADTLLKLADKARFFLMTIEGVRPHLDAPDAALWDCLDTGWRFPDVRDALDKRLTAVRELHNEKSTRLSNKRLGRLNKIGFALAVVGGLASAASIASFVRDDDEAPRCSCELRDRAACAATTPPPGGSSRTRDEGG